MLQELDTHPRSMGRTNSGSGTTGTDPHATSGDVNMTSLPPVGLPPVSSLTYTKFTQQADLGRYLTAKYHIRTANELSSCEVCHR